MDIRKCVFRYFDLGRKFKLVCILIILGIGSEVIFFVVIIDNKEFKKYLLVDYLLILIVVIIDFVFIFI